jgi:hypothetical protein
LWTIQRLHFWSRSRNTSNRFIGKSSHHFCAHIIWRSKSLVHYYCCQIVWRALLFGPGKRNTLLQNLHPPERHGTQLTALYSFLKTPGSSIFCTFRTSCINSC